MSRKTERTLHAQHCTGKRCVVCRALSSRRLVLVVRPAKDHPQLPLFLWQPFLGVAVAAWQVFGAAAGGVSLGTPTESRVRDMISRAVAVAKGRGFQVTVKRSPRLRVREEDR